VLVLVTASTLAAAACSGPGPAGRPSAGSTGARGRAAPITAAGVRRPSRIDERTVVYRTVGGSRLEMNVFTPPGSPGGTRTSGGRPAVMMLHGGAWIGGSRDALTVRHDVVTPLVSAGFVVFAPDYRLAPVNEFPDALDDARAALAWIGLHASAYGVNADRIGVWGGSAGGNLAAMLATDPHSTEPRIAAVASWSGIYDLPLMLTHPYRNFQYWVASYIACPPGPCEALAVEASPADRVGPATSPMLLFSSAGEGTGCIRPSNGMCDEPRYLGVPSDQARLMAGRLRAAGVDVTLVIVPGHEHARDYEDAAMAQTVRFFERHLMAAGT
jgi:acetyl esterase/lipase